VSWGALVYVGVLLGIAGLSLWWWAGRPGVGRAGHERRLRARTAENIEATIAGGRIPNHRLFTRVWLPRAALLSAIGAVALAAAWPLVRRRLGAHRTADPGVETDGFRRAGWWAMAALAGFAAWANAPRLGHSLWGDEENSLRRAIVGSFGRDGSGALEFRPATWQDTLFYYRDPNNHVLYSVAARATHTLLAKAPVAADETYFSEFAMRLPAFVAGALAVFSLAGLGAVVGWRRAGWVAAVLLVLHPWFVRYSTEARAYAFLLAGFPALVASFVLAARTGGWRWWIAAGALEWALLAAWPLSLHAVAAANLSALTLVWWRRPYPRADAVTRTVRWAAVSLAAAMLYLQLFLPHLIQLRAFLRRPRAMASLDTGGAADAFMALMTGRVWQDHDAGNPLLAPWARAWNDNPALVAAVLATLAAVFGAGLVRAWCNGRETRALLVALAAPPALMLGHGLLAGSLLLPWYLVPCLPGVLLLLAAGLDGTALRWAARPGSHTRIIAVGCLLFLALGAAQRERLRRHPIEPNREAARLVQPVLNPYHTDYQRSVLTGGFLMQISAYDPGVREFKDAAGLRQLIDEAHQSGRDFAVTYALPELGRRNFPDVMALLDDPAVFQRVATLHGLEPFCTRIVRRCPAGRPVPALRETGRVDPSPR
jgi:hypothetical protein